ncbi:COM1 regulatory protein [Hirsutella rhossiliensis]|uniref:COM1 regulatory protein n=1 Tax=Hirsutella rhossiliensis TaxID=111463 RepID=A0A9P8MWF0_9HYPO|nr:COM1 regulatory protein [Hirsutella rhossiliensis]KAH0962475.1 COM1 regulatory protein [Hirsutella rhossiliensis]
MNSLKVPESGLLLDGPSEGDSSSPPQAFVLSLSDAVVQNLVQSARNGEDLHLALGNIPTLHFGSQSHAITPPDDDVPYDLYLTKPFESTRKAERLPHTGSLFKKPKQPASDQKKTSAKAVKDADQKTNGAPTNGKSSTPSALESDIEALQNGLAAHDAARERARMVEKLPASRKGADKAKGKLWPNYNSTPKSMPTSPALNNSAASPSSTPALDASQQVMERKKEQRVVLVHELAVKDRTTDYLRGKWAARESEFRPTLEKMAEFSPDSNKWAMKKPCWKELDVWRYDYGTQEDRLTAIDNAVRQYDKQRLSSSEVEWQRLLPKEERGKGKCLSRLQANLAKGPAQQPAPKIKVQRADDSSGSKDDGDSLDTDKPKANGEIMSRSNSNPLPAKSNKITAQSAQAKRLLGNSKAKAAAQKPSPTKAKPVAKGSSGRVLSAAIIENSDSSGDEAPAQKAKPASSKPKDTVIVKTKPLHRAPPVKQRQPPPPPPPSRPPVKRSRDDDDSSSSSGTPLSKRIKPKPQPLPARSTKQRPPNAGPASRSAGAPSSLKSKKTSPTKSSPLASSPPTNASDLDEETPPAPSKKRKAENDSKPGPTKRRVVESVPTDVLSKAHKFKAYYQKYEALHYEISALDDPPHEKLADLLDMRGRLQMMKKEIYKQYSPDRE